MSVVSSCEGLAGRFIILKKMAKKHHSEVQIDGTPEHYIKHRRRRILKACLASLCGLLVIFVLLLGLAALIVWLILRPKSPSWSLRDVQVVTLNVQFYRSGRRLYSTGPQDTLLLNPQLNADLYFTIEAENANKKIKLVYDTINVYSSYADYRFGHTNVPPFLQGYRNTTLLHPELKAQSVPVAVNLGYALQNDIRNNKVLLQIQVDVKARVKIGSYKSFSFWVHTSCDIAVTAPGNGLPGKLLSAKC